MPRGTAAARSAWRLWPLALLALAFALFFALDLHRTLSLAGLQAHHERLAAFMAAHRALGALVFILTYAGIVLLSLPGATIMTLTAGLLFGPWLGTLYAVTGATLGASLLFLAARSAFGEALRRRAGPWHGRKASRSCRRWAGCAPRPTCRAVSPRRCLRAEIPLGAPRCFASPSWPVSAVTRWVTKAARSDRGWIQSAAPNRWKR